MQTILRHQGEQCSVLIASAFFNDDETLHRMLNNGCEIQLIVRLGIGTCPLALERILDKNRIDVRFFTGRSFHPKLYIFGNRVAYLGSSNLTNPGLTTNQEANIEIDGENPLFEDIRQQFFEYWNTAEVLDVKSLHQFQEILSHINNVDPWRAINNKIGDFEFNNVGRKENLQSKNSIYISSFKRSYQRYISKFNSLKEMYTKTGTRRFPEIPLRVEVDRFLWWIREVKAPGISYQGVPTRDEIYINSDIQKLSCEFSTFKSDYLEKDAVPRYKNIEETFRYKSNIVKLNIDDLYATLLNVHAFHDRFRFFDGGHPTMKETFLKTNHHKKIFKSIEYLLFGEDDYETRICNCVNDNLYKLNQFGESCVKELFGLVNNDNIPICNGRTLKSMEWLGFGKL